MLSIVLVIVGLAAVTWSVWMTVRVQQLSTSVKQLSTDVREIARRLREGDEREHAARARAEQALRVARERRGQGPASVR